MYLELTQMSREARTWVYQSDRILNDDEVQHAIAHMRGFLDKWKTHGTPLIASVSFFHKVFLVVAIDEVSMKASGCSIDTLVHQIKMLEQDLNTNFFNRMKVVYIQDNNINFMEVSSIKEAIEEGKLTSNTLVFDSTVTCLNDIYEKWPCEAERTWLNRYFKQLS